VVALGMQNSLPGRHHLHLARADYSLVAKIVLMLQLTLQYVGHDLHIPMRMRPETAAAFDDIIIEHPQRPPVHVGGVVVVAEGKVPVCRKPPMIGVVARLGGDDLDHAAILGSCSAGFQPPRRRLKACATKRFSRNLNFRRCHPLALWE
jgi:hypothetical protein